MMTRDQARSIDRHAIETLGIPACVLMENAGRGAAQVLQSLGVHGRVVIACGKGNNGGDGLVMARHLSNWGIDVLTLLFAHPNDLSADAKLQWRIVQALKLPTQRWADQTLDEAKLAAEFARDDWIVDALFGIGLVGPVRAPFDRVIHVINASGCRVLACDIPSGLNADTGEPVGATVRAAHTATFVAPKAGFARVAAWTGRVHVVEIGFASRDNEE